MKDIVNIDFNYIEKDFKWTNYHDIYDILEFLFVTLEKVQQEYMIYSDEIAEENGYNRNINEEIYNLTLSKGRKDLLNSLINELEKIIDKEI
jgi:hypothetical protein